jgi:hypothetical protein
MNLQPIVLKVGGQTSKDIKDLKANKGRLVKEIEAAVREHFPLTVPQAGATERKLVPVVLVFCKKRKRGRMVLQDVVWRLGRR